MTNKWTREKLLGNDGKKVDVHMKDDYRVCLNINRGLEATAGVEDRHGHHWWYEVSLMNGNGTEKYVGQAPTLKGAKKLATQHANI